MEELRGRFWGTEQELIDDIEELGCYDLLDITYEYVEVMHVDERQEDNPETIKVNLIRVRNTIALDI